MSEISRQRITGLFLVCLASFAFAADWPRWRGPNGDGISTEKDWDALAVNNENKPLWTAQVGRGFSAVTVADGRAVTMGNIKDTDVIFCFDAQTGKELWTYKYAESLGAKWYDGGTHGTPTIADGKVYVLSKFGKAFCLALADGKVIWQKGLKMKTPEWGFAGSPVIVGDKVIYNVSDHGIALNKTTGQEIWAGENKPSGYSTAVVEVKDNQTVIYLFNSDSLRCVNADTGDVLWSYPWKTQYDVNAADGKLIVISEKGKLMIAKVSPEKFELISSAQVIESYCWTMPTLANGKIYVRNAKGAVVCIDVSQKKTVQSVEMGGIASQPSWPQWQGPKRNNISDETGLLKSWPDGGPKILWSYAGLGQGYSTVSIAGGKIYTTGMVNKEGVLFCLDWDGKELWKQSYGPEWTGDRPGVRCTPTIDNDKIYVISGKGVVSCLNAADGKVVWQEDIVTKFEGKVPNWGYAESPLIIKDKVIFTVNGAKANIVALNKEMGKLVWSGGNLDGGGAYVSPIAFEYGGRTIIAGYTGKYVFGVDAADGKILWNYALSESSRRGGNLHTNTPVYRDGMLFFTSGYNTGAVMLKLSADSASVEKAWENKDFDVHHGSVVLFGDYLYGTNWMNSNENGDWMCVEWKTGKTMYQTHWENKGSLTSAEGMLYCYEEKNGNIALVKADPAGFNPVSTFKVSLGGGEHWAHPVVCGKRLFIRHGDVLMAFDIAAK